MTHDDACRLTVGTQLAHRDGTTWTVVAVPSVIRSRRFVMAELRGPHGRRGYLTEDNLDSFIPERPRCVERDALDHWVCTLAWGTPDRRAASALAAENQRGRWRRKLAVEKRAREARWPERPNVIEAQKASTASVRRLEGTDFIWNGTRHNDWLFSQPQTDYESRSRGFRPELPGRVAAPETPTAWDGSLPASAFDE